MGTSSSGSSSDDVIPQSESSSNEDASWHENLPNDSFDSLVANMQIGASIIKSADVIKDNLSSKLKDFTRNEEIKEIFMTDFHLRVLYGSRAFELPAKERYQKIDKILSVLVSRLTSAPPLA